ncbi:hypothetical protein TrVFT333_004330 [Trichoderma virens FT-333]|nr:hypothetical protein TrVFT333_004330 [Trichoderma virens FT-333]
MQLLATATDGMVEERRPARSKTKTKLRRKERESEVADVCLVVGLSSVRISSEVRNGTALGISQLQRAMVGARAAAQRVSWALEPAGGTAASPAGDRLGG